MKEFIDKLILRLKAGVDKECASIVPKIRLCDAIQIVKEVAEEYKHDMVTQLAMMYAQNMYMHGVDVTKAWETATSQSAALNEAYLRGLHDERKYQYTHMKNKAGWIPCSERLPDVFDNVLICTKEGGRAIGHRCPNQENGRYYDLHSSPIDDVIAWQHLPQPYMASIRSGLKINESEEKRMKEVTRIFTVEVTSIAKVQDDMSNLMPKEEAAEKFKARLERLELDNINIAKVQDFVMDDV